ncbi:MAG: glycosyltransferase family 4 protein [Chloroflexaceae bacterium]|jgi:glycosyltransferase involved in cell wall biosynthesis|nr:glycosyltransferase family 4 protein [Chloroflexaceae bacterium]
MNTGQKIGFVVPRYGVEVVGGAERLVRALAEQLHARGRPVEVFATCVLNLHEWKDHYQPGPSLVNGVPVQRFPLDPVDLGQLRRTSMKADAWQPVPYSEQIAFVRQAANSTPLYQQLRDRQHEFACFIFAPYIFGTTYWGAQTVADKALLLPCLHDEPYAHWTIYRELLESVQGILFNAEAERRFTVEQLGLVNPWTAVVGYGFETDGPPGDAARFRAARQLPPELLLYSGRLESGKNVHLLIDYFTRYKTERPGPLTLAFTTDRGDVTPPLRPDVVTLGFLSEEELRDAYASAAVLCQPSLHESFSIVMMEAWLQGTPALVHGDCAVTSEHVERSSGGWCFRSYEDFRAALDEALANPTMRAERGQAGRRYVAEQYNWTAVMNRLDEALDRFTKPRTLATQLAQRGVRRALDFARPRFDDQLTQVVRRAEADLTHGLSAAQVGTLRDAARVSRPDYQVQSALPLVGKAVAWLRRNLTSHLREPYLDPILAQQERFNQALLDSVLPALERSLREQRRLERQVRLLEQQLRQVQGQPLVEDEER